MRRAAWLAAFALGGLAFPSSALASGIDAVLAFDTTSSMSRSVEQAKTEARSVVQQLRRLDPATRFAVVQFRDYLNPAAEYEQLQAMTGDLKDLDAAVARLRVVGNPTPANTAAESYSVVFRRSYADPGIGWRKDSRKLVVVFGDAEPYGAGRAGFAGCEDTTSDPHGLDPRHELAAMRAAKRTLILIRIASAQATASAQCYESLASEAHEGGGAYESGTIDLAGIVAEPLGLVRVTLVPDLGVARPRGTAGFTVTLSNPNRSGASITRISALLPKGFRYARRSTTGVIRADPVVSGRRLTWRGRLGLRPSQTVALHFVTRAPARPARYGISVGADVSFGDETRSLRRSAVVRVTSRVARIGFSVRGNAGAPLRGRIRGAGTVLLPPRASSASRSTRGSVALAFGGGRQLQLRIVSVAVRSLGSPTVLRLGVRVSRAVRLRCAAGTAGTLVVRDWNALAASGRVRDRITLTLAPACRAAGGLWSNRSRPGAGPTLRLALKPR